MAVWPEEPGVGGISQGLEARERHPHTLAEGPQGAKVVQRWETGQDPPERVSGGNTRSDKGLEWPARRLEV